MRQRLTGDAQYVKNAFDIQVCQRHTRHIKAGRMSVTSTHPALTTVKARTLTMADEVHSTSPPDPFSEVCAFNAAILSDAVPPEVANWGPEAAALWQRESPARLLGRCVLLRMARLSDAELIALDDCLQSQKGMES
jgi:hypothetical protein